MKYSPFLFSLSVIFLLLLMVFPCQAQSVSFTDLHLTQNQNLEVYEIDQNGNTTYLGKFNSTDTIEINPTSNYQVIMQPSPLDWFEDPVQGWDYFQARAPAMFTYFAWFLLLFGLFGLGFKKMWG